MLWQTVIPEVVFRSEKEGGRVKPPCDLGNGKYMPHLVIGDPKQKQALTNGNQLIEQYLGVRFISGPNQPIADTPFEAELALMYPDLVDYSALIAGATFTIREGGQIIGHGRVLRRSEHQTP